MVSRLQPITSSTMRWHDYMLSCCGRFQDYVFEIPMRAGYSMVLDCAIECAASTLNWRLSGRLAEAKTPPDTVCVLYGRALKQLQSALKSQEDSTSTLTLCATQLLFLVEVSCHIWDLQSIALTARGFDARVHEICNTSRKGNYTADRTPRTRKIHHNIR